MGDPKFSLELKIQVRGGRKQPPFWQRYWQRILIAVSVAAIWVIAKQFW